MKALEAAEKRFEGYGLPRRSELQPVRNSFATNAALAAEGALYARTFEA